MEAITRNNFFPDDETTDNATNYHLIENEEKLIGSVEGKRLLGRELTMYV